jgi:hypothetical protein
VAVDPVYLPDLFLDRLETFFLQLTIFPLELFVLLLQLNDYPESTNIVRIPLIDLFYILASIANRPHQYLLSKYMKYKYLVCEYLT